MKNYLFKTTMKCSGCVAELKSVLENVKQIHDWQTDMASPDKTLSVQSEDLSATDIINLVEKAGFKAQLLEEKQF